MSCIYSTLLFVIDQSKQLRMEVPVLTFDQSLWHKATEIANAMSLSIVLILGGFRLTMSYVGSLGFVMKGSGLQEALETIYGSHTVEHMFTGKAIARALRGHFLTESALQTKLLRSLLPAHLMPCINESNDAEDVLKEKKLALMRNTYTRIDSMKTRDPCWMIKDILSNLKTKNCPHLLGQ